MSRRQRAWRRLRALRWPALLRWGTVALLSSLLVLDLLFPPPLPKARDTSTLVVARDGTPLRAFADRDGVWRYPATPESVSPLYLDALLNYEDRWFWKHPGVNPWAMLRAGGQWLRRGRIVSGGSTLTMQVARILDPHSRTPWGKLKQLLRALQLEAHLSKREILSLYLERAPFGGTIEGVEAASWAYLGKPATRLSQAEAALLAVLPQSPSRLRPDRHPDAARAARDKVLARMVALGVWTPAQVEEARIEPVVARSLQPPLSAALLAERLRQRQPRAARIESTVDADLQRTLEERVASYFSQLPARTSAALLVIDNASMEARAYVGSVTFGDKERLGHVDMVQAWRSPGSTLKPFLYGLALDDGLIHSESLLVDAPQSFGGYRPGNFDAAFNGPIGAAEALRLSLNVPAVDLLDRVGPARFSARLANAGIALKYPRGAAPNLALILGGTGARLEDLVGAFAAFNRGGLAGRVRYTPQDVREDRRLVSPGAAWIIREILESHPLPRLLPGRVRHRDAPAGGVEDRHQLRLPRRVGAGQHAPLHRRRVGRPAGRDAAAGTIRRGHRVAADVRDHRQPATRAWRRRRVAATGECRRSRDLLAAGCAAGCRRAGTVPATDEGMDARRRDAAHPGRTRRAPLERGRRGIRSGRGDRPAPVRRMRAPACSADPAHRPLAGTGLAVAGPADSRTIAPAGAVAGLRG